MSEARAELSGAFTEIKAADDAIVAVTRTIPEGARKAIAKARLSLTGRIMTLSNMAKGWLGQDRENEPGG